MNNDALDGNDTLMNYLAIAALAFAMIWPFNKKPHTDVVPLPPVVQGIVTPQQSATHMVVFLKYGEPKGMCTGTAIGPHAIMTAYHCNEDRTVKTTRLDNVYQEVFHIERILNDGREHDIYLLDGNAFTNIVKYQSRPTRAGEKVYIWGTGGYSYPPRKLEGVNVLYFDPSDVDTRNGQRAYSIPVIPGDSGSAVWSEDGYVLALTTYLYKDADRPNVKTLDFEVAFTDAQIAEAESFVPYEWTEKELPPPPPQPSFFKLF